MKVSGSKITIPAIKLPGGAISKRQTLDLTPFQGKIVRIYVDAKGVARINPTGNIYWQICAINLPLMRYANAQPGTQKSAGAIGVAGQPLPLDLAGIAITEFTVPK